MGGRKLGKDVEGGGRSRGGKGSILVVVKGGHVWIYIDLHVLKPTLLILGSHWLIAKCLSTSPQKDYIELEYYPNGNLKEYVYRNRASTTETDLKRWAYQMIESVAHIHFKGVRHSDIRLDQWLVDAGLNAQLSDFNASGFDDQPHLGLKGRPAQGLENPSHYLPRDPEADNKVESDLFALGSSLYELVAGQKPYEDLSEH
jgi:serine/threonine protein kinase